MPASARLLRYAAADPAWNMAVDRALLLEATEPTLRFYGWQPHAVSLGHFQRDAQDLAWFHSLGMPVVRRMTGGGAIVHAQELTYSLLLPLDHPVLEGADRRASYARLHAPIEDTLAALGVPTAHRRASEDATGQLHQPRLCFARSSTLDLLHRGRKLVGSAQRRSRTHVLQHGSILLAPHALQPGTASLAEALDQPPSAEELSHHLEPRMAALLGGLTAGSLTPAEAAQAEALCQSVVVAP